MLATELPISQLPSLSKTHQLGHERRAIAFGYHRSVAGKQDLRIILDESFPDRVVQGCKPSCRLNELRHDVGAFRVSEETQALPCCRAALRRVPACEELGVALMRERQTLRASGRE